MDSFWEEIRRCLADSVCELDRLIGQMQILAEKCPVESFDLVSHSLKKAKEKLGKLNEMGAIYSRSLPRNAERLSGENRASLLNEGEFWTIAWDKRILRMKGSKGVRLLSILVENPGRQFHVTDLEGYETKCDAGGEELRIARFNGCPILDDTARNAYRARLIELREELEEAQRFGDIFRASKIKEEMSALSSELARAVGLYGRSRLALSDGERARVRVTLAVKGAIEKISKYDRTVGWHLESSVRTGAFCMYLPAPIAESSGRIQQRDV